MENLVISKANFEKTLEGYLDDDFREWEDAWQFAKAVEITDQQLTARKTEANAQCPRRPADLADLEKYVLNRIKLLELQIESSELARSISQFEDRIAMRELKQLLPYIRVAKEA